jgi:ABC-type transport system involved in cytochrome c biogenesis ATPase subunit
VSDLVRTLNLVKTHRSLGWLTPSQQEAFAALCRELRVPDVVNLFGSAGVGKTFLAWTLADQLSYAYLIHPAHLAQMEHPRAAGVILDNCRSDRRSHRDVLKTLQFLGITHAVLITRSVIEDYTHYVELGLTSADQSQVQDNLRTVGVYREADPSCHLWHLINPYL